jgi:hypothetical protein
MGPRASVRAENSSDPTMPTKRKRPSAVTRADMLRLRRELSQLRTLANATAMLLDNTQRDCTTNLRRCGELQSEIDNLKKLLMPLA